MTATDKDTVSEAFALLEIALAVGRLAKHGLDDRCREFLRLLMARRDLSFAVIWVRASSIERGGRSDQFEFLSAIPAGRSTQCRLDADEPIFSVLEGKPWHCASSGDPDFVDYVPELEVDQGSVATFRLGDFGVLRLYSRNEGAFDKGALARDYSVIEAFATSVDAGLSERLLQAEIEERHRIEQQLLQSQKMEIIGRLAASVSHDFNNLLAVLQGSLDIEFFKNGNTFESMQTMQEAIDRGTELTRHLLNYSRSEEDLEPQNASLGAILNEVRPLIQQALGQAIKLRMNVNCLGYVVLTDPGFAKDAFLNIALNARDAMPDGGELKIETTVTACSGEESEIGGGQDAFVEISFTDTGVGMDEETVAQASKPFFTTKSMGTGTGIGLATVRDLTEKSGGTLNIESTVGVGTTISLKFPAWIGDLEAAQSTSRTQVEEADTILNVLVVEDSELYLDIISDQLELLGHRVTKAADGSEGYKLFQQHQKFDVILSDIILPDGYTGMELAHDIIHLKNDQKFIFMTGYSPKTEDEILEQFPEAQLLYKPFKLETLAEKIASAVDEETFDFDRAFKRAS